MHSTYQAHQSLPAFGHPFAPYVYGKPTSDVDFKTQPTDFVVEEVLGFQPCGEGEHLFLYLQTDDQNTKYTVKLLTRYFGVTQRLVSYSGLKDRRGLTRQWFSIHLPGQNIDVDASVLAEQGITLIQQSRHNRKLRIGTHKSNRFRILLRNASNPDEITQRLTEIAQLGVPNYFGAQRFGHGASNIEEALHWLEKQQLPHQRDLRSRVLSTLRSWSFNGYLASRVEHNSWNQWQSNDPIMLSGSQSFFKQEQWDDTLQQRLNSGDIHLGGWLPGIDIQGPGPDKLPILLQQAAIKASPRPMRLLPLNLTYEWCENTITISFELPTGTFATTVLREVANLNDLSLNGAQNQHEEID